jgi:hypothetical protein
MKKALFLAAILTITLTSFGQYKWDYGLSIGASNYLGDIGGKELTRRDFVWDMHMHRTHFAIGAYGRYKFHKRFSLAANFTFLQIRDADSFTTNVPRNDRNLNFRNRIFELGLRGEVTIFYDNDVGGKGYYNPDFKFYLFGGIAGYYHNPQGQILVVDGKVSDQYGGKWYNLRDFKTEGEDYSAIAISIPAGMGLYFTFDKKWRIGWELSWRTTFTDYLDDISTVYENPDNLGSQEAKDYASQALYDDPANVGTAANHMYREGFATKRGDPTHNDSYITTQLTIGRVIRGRSSFYRKKYSWLKSRTGSRRSRAKF